MVCSSSFREVTAWTLVGGSISTDQRKRNLVRWGNIRFPLDFQFHNANIPEVFWVSPFGQPSFTLEYGGITSVSSSITVYRHWQPESIDGL